MLTASDQKYVTEAHTNVYALLLEFANMDTYGIAFSVNAFGANHVPAHMATTLIMAFADV